MSINVKAQKRNISFHSKAILGLGSMRFGINATSEEDIRQELDRAAVPSSP